MTPVLVINSGSSSFKYQLIDMAAENVLAAGLVERIGEESGSATHTVFFFAEEGPAPAVRKATSTLTERIPDHTAGFDLMIRAFAEHGPSLDDQPPIVQRCHLQRRGGQAQDTIVVFRDVVEERHLDAKAGLLLHIDDPAKAQHQRLLAFVDNEDRGHGDDAHDDQRGDRQRGNGQSAGGHQLFPPVVMLLRLVLSVWLAPLPEPEPDPDGRRS